MLGFLILKARILTKCAETTLLKAACFCILHVIKKIEYNNSMPSVVIEVEVTIATVLCFLKCRLSGSLRYPLLFRNETLLRRCLFIMHICYGWIFLGAAWSIFHAAPTSWEAWSAIAKFVKSISVYMLSNSIQPIVH